MKTLQNQWINVSSLLYIMFNDKEWGRLGLDKIPETISIIYFFWNQLVNFLEFRHSTWNTTTKGHLWFAQKYFYRWWSNRIERRGYSLRSLAIRLIIRLEDEMETKAREENEKKKSAKMKKMKEFIVRCVTDIEFEYM